MSKDFAEIQSPVKGETEGCEVQDDEARESVSSPQRVHRDISVR